MVFLEGVIFVLGFYIFMGLSTYIYGVFSYYQFTETWNLNIENGLIADIFEYPKWMLFWLEWVVKKFKNRGRKDV